MAFLDHARTAFGIRHRLPTDTVEHFMRSRPLRWIEHNPLMALRVRSFTGSYYENQFIYMIRLRMSTALIMMLSVMEDRPNPEKRLVHGSSARVNNWQTLDIKHYLTFETPIRPRSVLSAYCIPMNAAWLELALLSDLNVDIDPRAWAREKAQKRLSSLNETISGIEKGFLNHSILGSRDALRGRVYRKLVTSIDFFRRSFSAGVRPSEAVVALAIAFEALLTDHYAPRVTERILRRVRPASKESKEPNSFRLPLGSYSNAAERSCIRAPLRTCPPRRSHSRLISCACSTSALVFPTCHNKPVIRSPAS
jgi:hypothetical protein